MEKLKAADDKLNDAIRDRIAAGNIAALEAIRDLVTWEPREFPFKKTVYGSKPRDAGVLDAPFFSEAYLYELLGKENARTVLAHVGLLCEALGTSLRDVQADYYVERERKRREELARLRGIVANEKKARANGHTFQKPEHKGGPSEPCPVCVKRRPFNKKVEPVRCRHWALPAIAKRAKRDLREAGEKT